MVAEKQPEICFQVLSNRNTRQETAYSTLFPANFRPNLILELGAVAGGGHAADIRVGLRL
jgi:hypothetical protein